jgi:hypothetical protein
VENRAIPQQLVGLFIGAAGLLLAILLGCNIGAGNYQPLIFGVGLLTAVSLALFSGPFFWIITISSSFLGGTFPILGGSFTPFQVLMAIGVGKFIVEDIVLRRRRLNFGNRLDLLLIGAFMAIITLHGIHDRFGMRFLGSSIWGGANYVNVYVGLAAFFVTQSISMQPTLWAKMPYAILAVTGFDVVVAVFTTIFPSSIYKIYPFYSAVSTAAMQEALTGNAVDTARFGPFGTFGLALITLILASVSLRKLFNPPISFRVIGLFGGFLGVLFSSYRSNIFYTAAVFLIAGVRDLKFKILIFLPLLAVFLFGLSVLNSDFVPLPKQMQRSLAFLPGKWDAEMLNDAEASNEFRRDVWTTFSREFFPMQPWLGRGFGFRTEEAAPSAYHPGYAHDYHQIVEVGNIHNGFLSCLDALGVIGTFFFMLWNLRMLLRTFQVSFRNTTPDETGLRFLALFLGGSILCYWLGAPNLGSFLPREFALAGVFLQLRAEGRRSLASIKSLAPVVALPQPDRVAVA